jgi:hypothetical protein
MRQVFFLLVVAGIAFGVWRYLEARKPEPIPPDVQIAPVFLRSLVRENRVLNLSRLGEALRNIKSLRQCSEAELNAVTQQIRPYVAGSLLSVSVDVDAVVSKGPHFGCSGRSEDHPMLEFYWYVLKGQQILTTNQQGVAVRGVVDDFEALSSGRAQIKLVRPPGR